MTVSYLAKAKPDLRASVSGDGMDWNAAGEKCVPVDVFDEHNQKVFTAAITMNVKMG